MEMHRNIFNPYACEVRKTCTHNTRFSSGGMPKLNSESGKRMFKNNSVKLWNRLPTQVRNIGSKLFFACLTRLPKI